VITGEILWNVLLILICYLYVLTTILVSTKVSSSTRISRRVSRKFLHIMIGNLLFIIPFFTSNMYPVLVAAPFVLITFLATPYSHLENVSTKMRGLTILSEEGHQLGLVFYAISYTFLALLFASKTYVMAAGILPMAYGDALASVIGEKYGERKYRIFSDKSLEGSIAMFIASFFSMIISFVLFSIVFGFSLFDKVSSVFVVAMVVTFVENFSPRGVDNLTVPASGSLTFYLLSGGI
jgi:phytol kinase